MDKIIVTGCAGFIGSHFCELLLANGYSVIGIDNFDPFYSQEIKERNLVNFLLHPDFTFYKQDITGGLDFVQEKNIKAIVHLAAKAGVRPSIEDPAGYVNTNIGGTQQVLEFMRKRSVSKLIFASSSSVYGNSKIIPFSESDNVDHPISPYAFTKKSGELLNYTYHHLYNIDVVNLRFFTVYGPRQRPDLAIHKFVKKILANEPITLYGNGETARDYTYIEDIISGIYNSLMYCIDNNNVYLTLNLGNSSPVKLNELVNNLYKATGKETDIRFAEMQPGDVDITFANIERAQTLLGYKPATSIGNGLDKFIKWYKINYPSTSQQ